jgi:DNA-binding SARP family transcriptional activator
MALLIHLSLARPLGGYLSRDTLCAHFWPDADEDHARSALSQALSRIRRSAGGDVIELRGRNELRIAPGAVVCDVVAFEEAIAGGQPAAALELYAGPFLCGFHAPGAPGFEAWAEAERARLQRLAAEAARTLAHQQIAAGRVAEAAEAAARALALGPEAEAVAAELVRALAAAGDRAGALGLYESWAAQLGRDLEVEPTPTLRALARALRDGAAALPAATSGPAGATPVAAPAVAASAVPAPAVSAVPTEASAPAESAPARRLRLRPRMVGASAVALVVLVGAWGVGRVGLLSAGYPVEASGRAAAGLTRQDWLVVADFDASAGDPGLALAFQTLLVRDLESAGYASVVGGTGALSRRGLEGVLSRMRLPPGTPIDADLACDIAEREGAAGVLAGRVLALGTEYVLAASIMEPARCEERIRASAVAAFDALSPAVTAVSRELRARLGESRASIRNSPPLPPVTVAYVAGLREVARYLAHPELWDDEVSGHEPLLQALRIDPDFAFGHFLLALHYQRFGRFEQAVPHLLRAHELRAELPRAGRLGMEAIHRRYIASDPAGAAALVEAIHADYPAIADATLPFLVETALWAGDAERALEVALTHLYLQPGGLGAALTLSRGSAAAWVLGRVALADSLHHAWQRAIAAAGGTPDRRVLLLQHVRHRDWAAADALCAGHPEWDRCGYVHLARGRLAAAAPLLARARGGGAAALQPWERAAATAALAHLEVLRGRPDDARRLLLGTDSALATGGAARAGTHLSRFLLCGATAVLAPDAAPAACRVEREDPAAWDADPSFTVVLRSGAWSRRLLAVRALERGDASGALAHARGAVGSNFNHAGSADHLLHGRAFEALGHADSALHRYLAAARIEADGAFPTSAGILLPLAPLHRRIGALAEAAGDHATARAHFGAFLALWADADPELQPQVQAVRARVIRLGTDAP